MSFKFRKIEKIVGVFLTLVIFIIIGVVILIGREQRWFEKHYQFTTKFLRGEGLSPGMLVTIKGIQVGEVKSIYLNEDNWIEVTFSVFEEYAERIKKDSVVRLRSPLIGSKSMEIIPGDKDQPVLASGSYIWSMDTEEGAKLLEKKIKQEKPDEITRILQNVEKLTYNLSDAQGSLEITLAKIQEFFHMLTSEDGSLNQTLQNLQAITRTIDDKEGSIGKLMSDNYELYNNITLILENLNRVIKDLQVLSKTMSDTSPEIKAAIERSNRTMDEAIGLMKTLQDNFFVKGFSSHKEAPPMPVGNAEREGRYPR